MSFFVNTRVVDLGGESDLTVKADGGEACQVQTNSISEIDDISKGKEKRSRERRTVGGLNGKFSGRLRSKWNVPPLYGLSD